MRTIIDLPPDQLSALTALCRREGISRAEAIRRILAVQLAKEAGGGAERAFGLWRGRRLVGLRYQQRARREWDARGGRT